MDVEVLKQELQLLRTLRVAIDTAFGERLYTIKQVLSVDSVVVRFIDLKDMTITLELKDIKED